MGVLSAKTTMLAIAHALEDNAVVTKAWPYPMEGPDVGQAVVGYPREFTLGSAGAFQRTHDKATFTVLIVAGIADVEETMDVVDQLLGEGAVAVRDAIEADLSDVVAFVNVSRGSVERLLLGKVPHAAVRYDVEVTA